MKKPTLSSSQPWRWFVIVLVLVVLAVVVWRISTNQKSNQNSPNAPTQQTDSVVMAVEAIKPSMITVSDSIVANGIIAAKETAQVSGHLTGATIEKVLVDVGDVVKAGQVLALLDDSTLTDALTQVAAELAQAQVTYAKAKADVQRVEPLLAIDAISQQEMDAYRATLEQAGAAVVASQARLKTAQTNLKNAQITAPVSGIISQKNAQVGLLVSGSPLFEIIVNGQLEWQANLAPQQASGIQIGQSTHIGVGAATITGQVSHLSPTTNSTREVVAHVLLPSGVPLKAGMYQTGQFLLANQTLPAIPVSALMTSDGYDYVWTLHKKEQDIYSVKRSKVQAGNRRDDKVVVDLPLESLIVKQSGSFLSEGDLVRVVTVDEPMNVSQTQGE